MNRKFLVLLGLTLPLVYSCAKPIIKKDQVTERPAPLSQPTPSVTTAQTVLAAPETTAKMLPGNPLWDQAFPGFLKTFGGPGNQPGKFYKPRGIAVDPNGNLWVADSVNKRVQVFDNNGQFLHFFPETPTPAPTASVPSGGESEAPYTEQPTPVFQSPYALAIDPRGFVYVSDPGQKAVFKFEPGGKLVKAWNGSIGSHGFSSITSMSADSQGNVYMADKEENTAFKVGPDGRLLLFIRGRKPPGPYDEPELAGVSADDAGNVYLTDTRSHWVEKYGVSGKFSKTWTREGTNDYAFSPVGLCADGQDDLYVVNGRCGGYRVDIFKTDGTFLGWVGQGGNQPGNFREPDSIVQDKLGNIYVTDSYLDCVVEYGPFQSAFLGQIARLRAEKPDLFVQETTRKTQTFYGVQLTFQEPKVTHPDGSWLPVKVPNTLQGYMDCSGFQLGENPTNADLQKGLRKFQGDSRWKGLLRLYDGNGLVPVKLGERYSCR
jgi:streptogramin lyase